MIIINVAANSKDLYHVNSMKQYAHEVHSVSHCSGLLVLIVSPECEKYIEWNFIILHFKRQHLPERLKIYRMKLYIIAL